MSLHALPQDKLSRLHEDALRQYRELQRKGLSLDLTRGKPGPQQLDLADAMEEALEGKFVEDSTDLRNYGGLEGLASARQLGAEILGTDSADVIAGGNSSLSLMYLTVLFAWQFGPADKSPAWKESPAHFLCPVPGYDRHFSICEEFDIGMIGVPMTGQGPDMDRVEALIRNDDRIRGMWCVPKYSNPTGAVYSDETVDRIARLGKTAHPGFRVLWDNAYAVHDLCEPAPILAGIGEACRRHGTEDSVIQFASTSKITRAGSGLAWLAASEKNRASFLRHLGKFTIGPDKINQARHSRFLPGLNAVREHMKKHAAILKPRFDCVLEILDGELGPEYGSWSRPEGGYFVSFDSLPGNAAEIIRLAKELGVSLTPAGSAFPYRKDPEDKNIRLAPTFPSLDELRQAMEAFVVCVRLATVKSLLKPAGHG
jgi:aspartate/methionine/tyrosine aminotransferase